MSHSSTKPLSIYDIAIIGGGIAGAGIALEASKKNLKVILFEKSTFGSGTSSKSSKLIHGGLRYLEVAWSALLKWNFLECWKNFRFVCLALRETHTLAREWPNLIKDIELLMPIYRHQGRSKWSVFFGTWLYGVLSRFSGGQHATRRLDSPEKILEIEPGLARDGLLGGVLVWDHTTDDLALVRTVIAHAVKAGAEAYENRPVIRYHRDRRTGIYDIDTTSGTFHARKLINASGAWVDQMRAQGTGHKSEMITPVAGSHIETKPFCRHSTILQAADGRLFFVINREKTARIGTTERIEKNPDRVAVTQEEITYLLNGVRSFFPQTAPRTEDIISVDAGIRPLAKPKRSASLSQISREHEFVRDEMGCVHILGVKLTDYRRAAQELIKKLSSDPGDIRLKKKSKS